MNKVFNVTILVSLVYFIFGFFVFGKLPYTFFQQDEWAIFGNYIYWDKADLDWLQRLFIYKQSTHLVPFTHLVSYGQFKLFHLNFFFYGVSAIIVHLVNAVLVCYLSFLLLRSRILSFISGFIFLTTSISHQGFTWIATTVGTSGSTLFLLLSLIFFTKYISGVGSKIRYLFLSMVFFITSLLFKETSIFAFLFFPAFWFIYQKKDFTKAKKALITLFLLGIMYVSVRIIFFVIGITTITEPGLAQPGLNVYIFRVFTLPLKFISQGILPQELIIKIANNIVELAYPVYPNFIHLGEPNPFIAQSVGVDIISYLFSLLVIIVSIIFLFLYKEREQWYGKTIVLSIVFIALSSLPFIFIPGKAGYFSLVDGRHLYATEIFTSILFSILGYSFYEILRKSRIAGAMLIMALMLLSYFHIVSIKNELYKQMQIGFLRKGVLEQIYLDYPRLPQKAIFYVESDRPYYGLPEGENILPFQSGFGQTLLVWYNDKGNSFPVCMFLDQYLYVQVSQGYRECQDRGFGYFRKKKDLRLAVLENNIEPKNIIGFSYNSSNNSLIDITSTVREELKNERYPTSIR